MVCGPVSVASEPNLLANFQFAEQMSLQALTMAGFAAKGPFLCNGANLAFKKEAFEAVGGYSGNDHLASGDDIFLLEKMNSAFPDKVTFLKSRKASTTTQVQDTWSGMVQQRIRWSSKTTAQRNGIPKLAGAVVFFMNFWILTALSVGIFSPDLLGYLAAIWFWKIMFSPFTFILLQFIYKVYFSFF